MLHVWVPGDVVRVKTSRVKRDQQINIGDEPGLNGRDHQMTMLVMCPIAVPFATLSQMIPRRRLHRTFRVNKQNMECVRTLAHRCSECIESRISRAAHNQLPAHILVSGSLHYLPKENTESLSEKSLCVARIAATLDVESNFCHHRVPPSSPILQSSPKRYFSNQFLSVSAFSRVSLVPPECRSHTKTLSVLSVNAETRVSECVVTIN